MGKVVWYDLSHKCEPPMADVPWGFPAEKIGSIWQCDCHKFWIVSKPIQVTEGQQSVAPFWEEINRRKVKRLTGGAVG